MKTTELLCTLNGVTGVLYPKPAAGVAVVDTFVTDKRRPHLVIPARMLTVRAPHRRSGLSFFCLS